MPELNKGIQAGKNIFVHFLKSKKYKLQRYKRT